MTNYRRAGSDGRAFAPKGLKVFHMVWGFEFRGKIAKWLQTCLIFDRRLGEGFPPPFWVWEFSFPGKIAKLKLKFRDGGGGGGVHGPIPSCVRHCGSQALLFPNMMLNIFRKERSLHGRRRPCLWGIGCLLEWYTLRGIGRERDGAFSPEKMNSITKVQLVVKLDYLPWSCERGKYWRIWFL